MAATAGEWLVASRNKGWMRVSAGRKNRREIFAEVVRAEYRPVYAFAWHLTGDRHNAVDLTQETFRVAWEKWSTFEGRSSIATWLHQIVLRKHIDQRRSQRSRESARMRVARQARHRQSGGAAASHTVAVEIKQDLETAVGQLNEAERIVIVLRYLQEMTVAETSQITGEPPGTVKWRTRQALQQLRNLLGTEEQE